MKNGLITLNIWQNISDAVKRCRTKSFVAVAYFGQGGSKMLPLKKGSKLVVDASEKAVKTGQTSPEELLLLYNKGVNIYSHSNLHAKVFVIGNQLFIGSTNVSQYSAKTLREAVLTSKETGLIKEAKSFIESLCQFDLGPEMLKKLAKIYNPPKVPGDKRRKQKQTNPRDENIPNVFVFNINLIDYPEGHETILAQGAKEAGKKRINKKRHTLDDFNSGNDIKFKLGDIAIQVINEGHKTFVSPPALMLHKKYWKKNNSYFVYLEVPNRRRKSIESVNKLMGNKSWSREGKKGPAIARKLISLWN